VAKVNINGQEYEVHEEVAEQFSKYIRRSKDQQEEIDNHKEKAFLYEIALTDIRKHQEISGGDMAKMSATHKIADTALSCYGK
jgi:5-methylcytosine-specific restriction endonuclease McrBC GTP-binding regulatory subunit McrB